MSEKKPDQVRGTRPSHQHRDPDGNTWMCNSPYCEEPNFPQLHPDDGGPQTIYQGAEPWRGK